MILFLIFFLYYHYGFSYYKEALGSYDDISRVALRFTPKIYSSHTEYFVALGSHQNLFSYYSERLPLLWSQASIASWSFMVVTVGMQNSIQVLDLFIHSFFFLRFLLFLQAETVFLKTRAFDSQ